jgi:carboxyl-terminal processing protease
VQEIVPLGPIMDQAGLDHTIDPGALKVTISKFYRPSGASTELRGVASDIVVPAPSGIAPVGESKLDDPLPWDTVPAAPHKPLGRVAPYLTQLRDASTRRLAADSAFDDLRKDLARFASRLEAGSVSLNEAERRRQQADDKALAKAIAAQAKAQDARITAYEITAKGASSPGLPPPTSGVEAPPPGAAASKSGAGADEPESAAARAADALVLGEALRILGDYVGLLPHLPTQASGP